MKSRTVIFAQAARADISDIYEWISANSSWERAGGFITRLEKACMSLDLASERGTNRDDIREGLRLVGFERSLTIVFEVTEKEVSILRIFRAGRDWETEPQDD
ncbi:MAG: type II toxin-antitoxin system RelE/ParE family toxin [Mesorhizobium sp.]|nr:type II toxin-antitoxin system RelE/ParE family toxin [Mesorhizobium sp.]